MFLDFCNLLLFPCHLFLLLHLISRLHLPLNRNLNEEMGDFGDESDLGAY